MRTRYFIGIICAILIFGGCLKFISARVAQSPVDIDAAIKGLSSANPMTRMESFYALMRSDSARAGERPFIPRIASAKLLRANPTRAEKIKTALINAIVQENIYVKNSEKRNFQLTENYSDYYGDLIGAVAFLQDVRSLNGLLGAITTGGMVTDGLADLGAPAVDGAYLKLFEEDPLVRAGATRALGKFLQRPQLMESSSEAQVKAQRGLMRALNDQNPHVRAAAVESVAPIRDVPEIRQKLESMPERSQPPQSEAQGARSPVRESINRTLSVKEIFWVTRAEGAKACRIQSDNELEAGAKFLGPYSSRAEARKNMCTYFDETKSNAGRCWEVIPQNACN